MSFEIGPLQPIGRGTGAARRVDAVTPGFSLDLARRKTETPAPASAHSSVVPETPPLEVRDAIRDLAGNVIRTIPPSRALDIMAGAAV
jgi:hypothetical protein